MMKKFLFAIAAVLLLCGTSAAADKKKLTPDDFDMGRVERIESDVEGLKREVAELRRAVDALTKSGLPVPGSGVIAGKVEAKQFKKVCDEDGCRLVPVTNGGRVRGDGVEERTADPLPAGYSWEDTPNGLGLRDPLGRWYLPPDPYNTAHVRQGWSYVPTPEHNGYPRGYWRGYCTRAGSCDGPISSIVTVAQDGKPVDAVSQNLSPFNPNQYPGGIRLVPKDCRPVEIQSFPIPIQITPGFAPQYQGCPNGQCPIPSAPGGGHVIPFRSGSR